LSGWKYRKEVTLSRESGEVTDYQMMLLIGESSSSTLTAFLQEWNTQPYATKSATTVNSSGGILNITSTSNDPYIHMPTLGFFNPHIHKYIDIKYRVLSGTAGGVEIYFYNTRRTSANEDQCVRDNLISDGQWHIVTLNMSDHQYWTNSYVTGWRYDWCTASGVNMEVDYIKLWTSADVHCEEHCLSNFNDIRFTTSNGITVLDYWIESISGTTPNQVATIWVEFNSIETSSTTFYMYYNNPDASVYSNISDTFIFADDFEYGVNGDNIKEDWTLGTYHGHISTDRAVSGTRSVKLAGVSGNYPYILRAVNIDENTYISFKVYHNGFHYIVFIGPSSSNFIHIFYNWGYIGYGTGTGTYHSLKSGATNQWYTVNCYNINFTNGTFTVNLPEFGITSNIGMRTDGGIGSSYIEFVGPNSTSYNVWHDNIIVRNWRSVDPVFGIWGIEEENNGSTCVVEFNNWNKALDVSISDGGQIKPAEEAYIVVNGVWKKWWPPPE
jgi:hypothetical protein